MAAACIKHGDGCAVDNALRAYIHIGTGCHLAILRHPHSVEPFPVVGPGVIGDDHAVGDDDARRVAVRGEKPEGMTRVHDEGLLVGHLAQVFHGEKILRPVLEHRPVAAVGDKLVGMLCHGAVEVVLNHHHDCGSLTRARRVVLDGTRIHLVDGTETVHVDAAIVAQLLGKLGSKHGVVTLGEIAQGVFQREAFLLGGENLLAAGRMIHRGIIFARLRQFLGNTGAYQRLKFFFFH